MPQFSRSVAFSNKKKKAQLKAKRERKKFVSSSYDTKPVSNTFYEGKKNRSQQFLQEKCNYTVGDNEQGHKSTNSQLSYKESCNIDTLQANYFLEKVEEIGGGSGTKQKRYTLKFRKTNANSEKLKRLHHERITLLPEETFEAESKAFYPLGLDYPKRPEWRKNMSKADLDQSENKSFRLFWEEIDRKFQVDELSLYELNLETWRQLWRVTEMSDILLIIVDARYCVAQFPPYLYTHLVEKENKGVILILNKCDLLTPSLVIAWQDYFVRNYPKLIVIPFASYEGKQPKKSSLKLAYYSSLKLIEACQTLVDGNVDLRAWRHKVEEEREQEEDTCEILQSEPEEEFPAKPFKKYGNGILSIGTIGHPNVGKSSLINALKGKKVVSVSKTPGHTKYFQTIFITKNIKLCDCPGLVFPSLCPKQLQVIIGSYPIAQVSDPISSVHYLASRLNLPQLLGLKKPDDDDDEQDEGEYKWTPFLICEAWAQKRGYFVRTKGGRPDVFRAGNELLRFALVGFKSLIICLKPPHYFEQKDLYEADPRCHEVQLLKGEKQINEASSVEVRRTVDILEDENETSESERTSSEYSNEDEVAEEVCSFNRNKFGLLSLN